MPAQKAAKSQNNKPSPLLTVSMSFCCGACIVISSLMFGATALGLAIAAYIRLWEMEHTLNNLNTWYETSTTPGGRRLGVLDTMRGMLYDTSSRLSGLTGIGAVPVINASATRPNDDNGRRVDLVVARTREDGSWLATLERAHPELQIYVYEKVPSDTLCGGLLQRAVCVPVKNVGREAYAYLTYLVDFYDELAPKIVFAQGHAPDERGGHVKQFDADYIQGSNGRLRFTNAVSLRQDGMYDIYYRKDNSSEGCGTSWSWSHTRRAEDAERTTPLAYWKTNLEKQIGEFPMRPVAFARGATFSTSRDAVRKLPIDFYVQLLNTVSSDEVSSSIYYLEMFWAYVFGFASDAEACGSAIRVR